MLTIKSILLFIKRVLTVTLPFSFLLMPINIILYYGFTPTIIHPNNDTSNSLGLTIALIWFIHLSLGFLAGMVFSKTQLLLTGSIGILCAFLITGISLLYFDWRNEINTLEILIPLIFGILPPLKLYGFINHKQKTTLTI